MNKKLVAVAVAGLLAAPLAAQAQTANVTLYGRLNITMEAVNGAQAQAESTPVGKEVNRTVYRLSSNSSRLGVRGSESLGGGLSAIFQIESSINGDSGGGTLAGRETFVGLQGTWGTFKMGNFLAPYDDIHPIFGNVPTLTTSILSTAALWAQGSQTKDNGGFDARLGNSIRYDSPRIGGFLGSIQIAERRHVEQLAGAAAAPRLRPVDGRFLRERPVPGRSRVRSEHQGPLPDVQRLGVLGRGQLELRRREDRRRVRTARL